MQQARCHYACVLAKELSSQIQDKLSQRNLYLLLVIQALSSLSLDSKDILSQCAANNVPADSTQLEILKLLKELKIGMKHSNETHSKFRIYSKTKSLSQVMKPKSIELQGIAI